MLSSSPLLSAVGGLGLFLLGLSLMTEGLRSLAGARLRRLLLQRTRSPWSGAWMGALMTALLQSSSVTTVATVGFVSAGLLTFQASLGILFGANVGSTGLGWLVALLGLKLHLMALMLPLVLLGAVLRLLGRGRQAQLGLVLAGGGLLFIGIAGLQQAMAGHGLLLDPSRFDGGSLIGRLQLVLLGLLTTVITQSSGAGVAACLAGLAAGALELPQALALVIGFDLGSTVTALIAAIGASLSARRTAAAHLAFNLFTAGLAFGLLPLYLRGLQLELADPLLALTLFHSSFNLLGLLLLLPFTAPFGRLICRLIPGQPDRLMDRLPDIPDADPVEALTHTQAALHQTFVALVHQLSLGVQAPVPPARSLPSLAVLQADLDRLELHLDQIHSTGMHPSTGSVLLHQLHALDHLQRLHERCAEEPERQRTAVHSPALQRECQLLRNLLVRLLPLLIQRDWPAALPLVEHCAGELDARLPPLRDAVMLQVGADALDLEQGTRNLQAMRWLARVSQHLCRITQHLSQQLDC
jgi:phosphate:Na+ symporter